MSNRRRRIAVIAGVATFALAGGVAATQAAPGNQSVTGRSTLDVTICRSEALCPTGDFSFLKTGPGENHFVREDFAPAGADRRDRRRSLAYFVQISDFQLTDEESPARVEAIDDEPSGIASSAWRPQEAMLPHMADRTIRQVNRFLRSPVPQGDGSRASLLNAVLTGDLADSMQRNETQWVVQLLEGGAYRNGRRVTNMLDPNSGTRDRNGTGCTGTERDIDNPRKYTGVQDYDDFPLGQGDPNFYDPDEPARYDSGDWPRYTGLMDRAQTPFAVEGLKVPSYVAFGNHDNLVQGNEDAIRFLEDISTGCIKPLLESLPGVTSMSEEDYPDGLPRFRDPLKRLYDKTKGRAKRVGAAGTGQRTLNVPRDENRQFVDKAESRRLYRTGKQADQHGFGYIDPAELRASSGNASYYSFSPKPGIRNVIVDTVSEGGQTPTSSEGNIDDPQFRWLRRTLAAARARDELVFVFSHHAPSTSQEANVPDEVAPPCSTRDRHGHDTNPGCDRDPRASTPIHTGDETIDLVHRYPNVLAWVAGHSHDNEINALEDDDGRGGFWEIKSPAIADWTTHHRLLEVMDNRDGTLSIFGTLLDLAAPVGAPRGGNANVFDATTLSSVGRTLTYNDPQQGPDGSQGTRADRNVELLIEDPRDGTSEEPRPPISGTSGDDVINGTSGDDVINCGAGDDRVNAGAGDDVVNCGAGNDVIRGGSGHDRLNGGEGNDEIHGDSGDDRIDGGPGEDEGTGGTGSDSFLAVEERDDEDA